MNNYDVFQGEELAVADLIKRRRLQMLVHSCLYYEFNSNIITDSQWDVCATELAKLQNDYPSISEKVEWYPAFRDWDGSTGAFLPLQDPWVRCKAEQLYDRFTHPEGSRLSKPIVQAPKRVKKENPSQFKLF